MTTKAHPILVTGAAGFIGNHVAHRLHAAGRAVVGTDIARPYGHGDGDFPFVQADVRDLARHAAIVARGCDGIVHCGAISGPMLSRDNPAELIDINVRGTIQLMELARIHGLRRFIGCSSVSAYGDTGDRATVTEETPLSASSVYGSSKAAMDLLLQTYAGRLGLSAAALRIGWVYGPYRRTDGVMRPMIRSGFAGPAFHWDRGSGQRLQFVHVEDVSAALIAAFDAPVLPRTAYNINGAEVLTLGEIADAVRKKIPAADIAIGPGPMDDTDHQGDMILDAAATDFGWRPRVSFAEGLSRYADWLSDNEF